MRNKRYVYIEFDFEESKISFGETYAGNGTPLDVYHNRAHRHTIANDETIIDPDEIDQIISFDQRAEFASLCETHYQSEWNGSNRVGLADLPLREFVAAICDELDEEHNDLKLTGRTFPGLAFIVDAADIIENEILRDSGVTMLSTDEECSKIADELDELCLRDFQQSLEHTEDRVLEYRNYLRDNYNEQIVYVVTNGAQREECSSLSEAICVAVEWAENCTEKPETIEQWGDSLETGWGACPNDTDGAYWPQIHAEFTGKRIDRLPWEKD